MNPDDVGGKSQIGEIDAPELAAAWTCRSSSVQPIRFPLSLIRKGIDEQPAGLLAHVEEDYARNFVTRRRGLAGAENSTLQELVCARGDGSQHVFRAAGIVKGPGRVAEDLDRQGSFAGQDVVGFDAHTWMGGLDAEVVRNRPVRPTLTLRGKIPAAEHRANETQTSDRYEDSVHSKRRVTSVLYEVVSTEHAKSVVLS